MPSDATQRDVGDHRLNNRGTGRRRSRAGRSELLAFTPAAVSSLHAPPRDRSSPPHKGEYAANLQRIGAVLAQVARLEPRIDLVVFPRPRPPATSSRAGCVTSPSPRARCSGTSTRAVPAAPRPLDVAIGFYEVFQNHLYNSCLYATLGGKDAGIRHVHRKVFLPTYGVFDEERFVERGPRRAGVRHRAGAARRILICEDAWHSLDGDASRRWTARSSSSCRVRRRPRGHRGRTRAGVAAAGERGALGADRARHRGRARRLRRATRASSGFEGGKGFPGGIGRGRPAGGHPGARPAVRGSDRHRGREPR